MRSNGFVKIVAQHPPKGAAIQLTAILGTQSGQTSTNIPVNKAQEIALRVYPVNIRQPMLKLKTHSGFHDLFFK